MTRRVFAASVLTALLFGCGKYGAPVRPNAESVAAPPAAEACEDDEADAEPTP